MVHFVQLEWFPKTYKWDFTYVTVCGEDVHVVQATNNKHEVTCPLCQEKVKELPFYKE